MTAQGGFSSVLRADQDACIYSIFGRMLQITPVFLVSTFLYDVGRKMATINLKSFESVSSL